MEKDLEHIRKEFISLLTNIDLSTIKTNGCSFSPDWEWIKKRSLVEACNKHDIRYELIRQLRIYSDKELEKDISSKGWKVLDNVMFYAVKYFGRLFV